MYFIKIALRRLTMRPWSSMFLIIGMAFVLAVGSALFTLSSYLKNYSGETSHPVYAFIKPTSDAQKIEEIKAKIQTNSELTKYELIDQNAFLETLSKNNIKFDVTLTVEDKDVLPRYFVVNSKNPTSAKSYLANIDGIEYAEYDEENLNKIKKTFTVSSAITKTISAGLFLILIIALINQLKVTIFVNKDEVEILTLLGANQKFVFMPIITESIIYGFFGGFLGWLIRIVWEYKSHNAIDAFLKTLGYEGIRKLSFSSIGYFLLVAIAISACSAIIIRPKQKGFEGMSK